MHLGNATFPVGMHLLLAAHWPGQEAVTLYQLQFCHHLVCVYTYAHLSVLDMLRFRPEILDGLNFPSSLGAEGATPLEAKKAPTQPSALDALVQLLKNVPELLDSHSQVVAGLLRVLLALWESQPSTHGVLELLRAQPELWVGLKVSYASPARAGV